jgi:H+/Cl- antiporter ClcA
LRRFLRWAFWAPVAILVVAFAVANRRWVTLSLDPFSQEAPSFALDMPLWLLLFIGIFIGLIFGWFASWLAQGKWRKAARESKSEVAQLQQELADLRRNPGEPPRQDVTAFPGSFM